MQTARGAGMHGRRLDGFTLLELMVTLAVAAILVTIAIPSYRGLVQRNTLTASVNDLVGDLNYARSEAVTRGQNVYLCKSKDEATCETDGDWSQGWIVFTPDADDKDAPPKVANLLRVRGPLDEQITIGDVSSSASRVSFDANGFAGSDKTSLGNTTLTVKSPDVIKNTKIIIFTTGRIRTESMAAE